MPFFFCASLYFDFITWIAVFDSMPQVYFTMNIMHESWVFGSAYILGIFLSLRAVICVGKEQEREKEKC